LTGAPTARVNGSGGADSRSSQTPSAAQSAAGSSSSHIALDEQTDVGIATWCSGWKLSGNSFGRTSNPYVSVAIAAISVPCSQPAVWNDEPASIVPLRTQPRFVLDQRVDLRPARGGVHVDGRNRLSRVAHIVTPGVSAHRSVAVVVGRRKSKDRMRVIRVVNAEMLRARPCPEGDLS
jgi:hypothetical protein